MGLIELFDLFTSNDSNEEIKKGDRVKVGYAGIEGIVVEVENNQVMISYMIEDDKEIVETYYKDDVEKC